MYQRNTEQFDELRELDLPIGEYVVCASGPLGIRHLREMSDLDIKLSDKLWDELSQKYEVIVENGLMKIRLSENIEAMCEASFSGKDSDSPKIDEQLRDAEIIDGLPFENIRTTLYFKKQGRRDKDKRDVELIEKWLRDSETSSE